jgi:hypothetical protein
MNLDELENGVAILSDHNHLPDLVMRTGALLSTKRGRCSQTQVMWRRPMVSTNATAWLTCGGSDSHQGTLETGTELVVVPRLRCRESEKQDSEWQQGCGRFQLSDAFSRRRFAHPVE